MRNIILILTLALATPLATPLGAQENKSAVDWTERQPHWAAPFEPFNIIGNLYYVGTEGLAVYLITGPEGHVLIDGGLPGYEQMIIDNIAALGFDIKDVKYLLNTHAHFDHSGGLAALKEASGAELWASEGDAPALEGGVYAGFEDKPEYAAPPVKVDRVLNDRDSDFGGAMISLTDDEPGKPFLLTTLTPGHSRGCTSFRLFIDDEREHLDILIFCSATVAANRLVASDEGPAQYDGIVDDYRLTFEKTKDWTPDIFLANHPEVFDLKDARERQLAGNRRAFLNRGAFQKYIVAKRNAFEEALAEQTDAVNGE